MIPSFPSLPQRRLVHAGDSLAPADSSRLWRLHRGLAASTHRLADVPDAHFELIARPGDLLGADRLAGQPVPASVLALTEVVLEAVECDGRDDVAARVAEALGQGRRQALELLWLRSGGVGDRLTRLLLMMGEALGNPDGAAVLALPTLRDMATILDSTPESVCRALTRLRAQGLVGAGASRRTHMAVDALRRRVRPGVVAALAA